MKTKDLNMMSAYELFMNLENYVNYFEFLLVYLVSSSSSSQ